MCYWSELSDGRSERGDGIWHPTHVPRDETFRTPRPRTGPPELCKDYTDLNSVQQRVLNALAKLFPFESWAMGSVSGGTTVPSLARLSVSQSAHRRISSVLSPNAIRTAALAVAGGHRARCPRLSAAVGSDCTVQLDNRVAVQNLAWSCGSGDTLSFPRSLTTLLTVPKTAPATVSLTVPTKDLRLDFWAQPTPHHIHRLRPPLSEAECKFGIASTRGQSRGRFAQAPPGQAQPATAYIYICR